MSKIYKIYVKTHAVTGLKYLGQTVNNPFAYLGSGVYWKKHLNKHGPDHHTEVIHECHSKEELREWGLFYSRLWNIVESDDWANLKEEQGDGGRQSEEVRKRIGESGRGRIPWNKGKQIWDEIQRKEIGERNRSRGPQSAETIAKRVAKNTGKKRSQESLKRMRDSQKGKKLTEEHRAKLRGARPNARVWNRGLKLPPSATAMEWIIKNQRTGDQQVIKSLRKWCEENNINYQVMHSYTKQNKAYKDYVAIKLDH